MSAMFVINIHVPDSNSEIIDASLSMAGRDALDLAASEPAIDSTNHSSKLTELLSLDHENSLSICHPNLAHKFLPFFSLPIQAFLPYKSFTIYWYAIV